MTLKRLAYCVSAAAMAFLSGCAMSGNYQSARTLEKGTSDVGLTFSVNTIMQDSSTLSIPNVIPEFAFHTGIAENLDVGGRISLAALAIEGDVKYRFFHNETIHLAIDPAISFQALVTLTGLALKMPLIATFDLSDRFALNGAFFGSYTHYSANKINGNDYFSALIGDRGAFGLSIGPEIRGEVFYIRPMFELCFLKPVNQGSETVIRDFTEASVIINLGWIIGREKKQLDRIEKKIDDLKK